MIESRSNPQIKRYLKLCSRRNFREQEGVFPLEGVRLIADAAASGAQLERLFLTDSCLLKFGGRLRQAVQTAGSVLAVSEAVAAQMSQVETPQGAFALVKMLDNPGGAVTILKKGGWSVGLCGLQDPGNVGTILRTADAFGFDGALLCGCCDIYSPKVVRSTMGALFHLPVARVPELLSLLQTPGLRSYAAVVDGGAVPISSVSDGGGLLLIGNEANGLPAEIAAACSERVTIPMRGRAESLNAAIAAAVCMYEMQRGGKG